LNQKLIAMMQMAKSLKHLHTMTPVKSMQPNASNINDRNAPTYAHNVTTTTGINATSDHGQESQSTT